MHGIFVPKCTKIYRASGTPILPQLEGGEGSGQVEADASTFEKNMGPYDCIGPLVR